MISAAAFKLEDVEDCVKALENLPRTEPTTVSGSDLLAGWVDAIRATVATIRGDADGILYYAPLALAKLPVDSEATLRSNLLMNLSFVNAFHGNLEAASENLADAVEVAKKAVLPFMVFNASAQRNGALPHRHREMGKILGFPMFDPLLVGAGRLRGCRRGCHRSRTR